MVPFSWPTYQMFARHFADADHPDGVWRHRLVVEGGVHEGAGTRGRSLVVFGGHGIVRLQQGLWRRQAGQLRALTIDQLLKNHLSKIVFIKLNGISYNYLTKHFTLIVNIITV